MDNPSDSADWCSVVRRVDMGLTFPLPWLVFLKTDSKDILEERYHVEPKCKSHGRV